MELMASVRCYMLYLYMYYIFVMRPGFLSESNMAFAVD